MATRDARWWLFGCALLGACESTEPGGITAQLVFSEGDGRQALRTAAVPSLIDHLQITALDTTGSTLAQTHLRLVPGADDQLLNPAGGTWELKGVPSGKDRIIRATAFLGESPVPRLNRALAYVGTRNGIEVNAGQINDIGQLILNRAPVRIPETDDQGPSPPNPVTVLPLPTGGALRVTFSKPPDDDVAGYVLALAATASIAGGQPLIASGTPVAVGDALGGGFVVKVIWAFRQTEVITLDGLEDGVPYTVLVYAYDGDDADDSSKGNPLNFSLPASGFSTPVDSTPPGPLTGLTVVPAGGLADIRFTAPGDDRGNGVIASVANFELRAALTRTELETAPAFESRPDILPPMPEAPGMPVSFTRTLAALGIAPGVSFYIGMRAVDAADNTGAIAVAQLTYNATIAPQITTVSPPIGLAGREVIIGGRDFGVARGTAMIVASETSTLTFPMPIARWSDAEVAVILPQDARTGELIVTRPDGLSTSTPLIVLGRGVGPFDEYEYPFEIIGRDTPGGSSLAILYAQSSNETGALERVFDGVNEVMRYAPRIGDDRATAVAGAYSPRLDLFWLLSNDEPNEMSASFINSSTVTVTAFNLDAAVAAGSAESVAVVFLGAAAGPAAGMIAFSVNGVIRTATVADVRTDRFNGFYASSSTISALDRVHLAQKSDGALLMAWRDNGTTDYLKIANNPIGLDPNGFTPVVTASPPQTGPGIEIVALDIGGTEEFIIAYESVEAGGRLDVRLLRASDYGSVRGYAPFAPLPTDRRLDDLGLVTKDGEVYLAVIASRVTTNVEPSYAEVPLSALVQSQPDGGHPGVVLDTAPFETRVRLGCKERALGSCPIFLSSDFASLLYIRR